MNATFALRSLVCFLVLSAQICVAHGQDISISQHGDNVKQAATSNTTPAPLIPIPEPSTESLILLSLGGIGLAMKLRKTSPV
jgi:hypothetical protein